MDENERKARQEFQRQFFLLIKTKHQLELEVAKLGEKLADLYLLNDEILNGDKDG